MSYVLTLLSEVENRHIMPDVKYYGPDKTNDEYTDHHFYISHPNLNGEFTARVRVKDKHPETSSIDVYRNIDDQRDHDKAGNLSISHERHILGRIRYHLPDVQAIDGARITGARTNSEHKYARANVARIYPIPPK